MKEDRRWAAGRKGTHLLDEAEGDVGGGEGARALLGALLVIDS
jgi:hypothetical protein